MCCNWVALPRHQILGLDLLICLLFSFCVANKCFPLRVSWQEVANYCSSCLICSRCAPPAGLAGLETHLNIDQTPGKTAWGLGPLACSRALLMGRAANITAAHGPRGCSLECVCVCVCVWWWWWWWSRGLLCVVHMVCACIVALLLSSFLCFCFSIFVKKSLVGIKEK